MSIFPEKNANGQLTGFWIVKVMRSGKTRTFRTRDNKEARQAEVYLKNGMEPVIASKNTPVVIKSHEETNATDDVPMMPMPMRNQTLGQILPEIKKLYKSTKDENGSLHCLEKAFAILGMDKAVISIRTAQLDKLVKTLKEDEGLSNKRINRYLAPVSKALKWAHAREMISSLPSFPRQKEGKGRDTVLEITDQPEWIDWLDKSPRPDMGVIARVLLITGFRISELLTRRPQDLKDGWLTLRISETKNDEKRGTFIGELEEPFRELLMTGLPPYNTVWKWFVKASKATGGTRVTPHVLRHTVGTRLNDMEVSTADIQEYLGHKTIATTLKYIKVRRTNIQKASEALLRQTKDQTNVNKTSLRELAETLGNPEEGTVSIRISEGGTTDTADTADLQSAPFAARDTLPR